MSDATSDINKFFNSECLFGEIPAFQRDYIWNHDLCGDLYDDIERLYSKYDINNDTKHFFGTIILQHTKSATTKYIIDGQQRLTTITLFLAALYHKVPKESKYDLISDNQNIQISSIIDKILRHSHDTESGRQYGPRMVPHPMQNLTILDKIDNSKFQASSFIDKINYVDPDDDNKKAIGYKSSPYRITSALTEYQEFNEATVNARCEYLAQKAAELWKFKYFV